MKFSTEFMEYLKYTVTDTIYFDENGGDGSGEFTLEGTNFKSAEIEDSKKVFPRFETSFKVSEKLKEKHRCTVKNKEIGHIRRSVTKFALNNINK